MKKPLGKLSYIIVDCQDNQLLAKFWGNVLGVRIASEVDPYVELQAVTQGQPALSFQKVKEVKNSKNRLHLDVAVDDLNAATLQIEHWGGKKLKDFEEDGQRWRWMADPEGNEFCLIEATKPD